MFVGCLVKLEGIYMQSFFILFTDKNCQLNKNNWTEKCREGDGPNFLGLKILLA